MHVRERKLARAAHAHVLCKTAFSKDTLFALDAEGKITKAASAQLSKAIYVLKCVRAREEKRRRFAIDIIAREARFLLLDKVGVAARALMQMCVPT
jgi:hypothetical protein